MLSLNFSRHFRYTDLTMVIERDERPWGFYEVLAEAPGYKVKRIEVKSGHRLSLQLHDNRSEHWVIVQGSALATIGDQQVTVGPNQHVLIPQRTRHRVASIGDEPLVFIEVQCGSYLGEDDITRFEDDYNRTQP
jgi:mannose-6-phosphate isomerase